MENRGEEEWVAGKERDRKREKDMKRGTMRVRGKKGAVERK